MHSDLRTKRNTAGFTLVELLVSVSLFAVVMMISVGTLLSLVDANRQSQSLKSVTNNLNFALDTMTRTLRTGLDFSCGADTAVRQDCPNGDTKITFLDDRRCLITYEFVDSHIERSIAEGGGSSCQATDNPQRLTAPEVVIEEAQFYVTGSALGDGLQPTVTIVVKGRAGANTDSESVFNIQTTVTQRLPDR